MIYFEVEIVELEIFEEDMCAFISVYGSEPVASCSMAAVGGL